MGWRSSAACSRAGAPPFGYLKPLHASLFLSANPDDVRDALDCRISRRARIARSAENAASQYPDEIRIAFDGDAVLFSDEAEHVFQNGGLRAFVGHEIDKKDLPLADGPLKPLLEALHKLQKLARRRRADATFARRWSRRVRRPRTSARSGR